MSETIIYGFGPDGICTCEEASAKNAWRGAMAIWKILEKKYLPPYRPRYVPASVPDNEINEYLGFEPTRVSGANMDAMNAIWHLFIIDSVSITDKIVLGTTFDNVLVRREDIPKVIEAFEAFDKEHDGMTNLKEQADGLRAFYEDEDVSAVGWNQTSVNGDDWSNAGDTILDEDGAEIGSPYNYKTGKKHWWLFDELEKPPEDRNETE